MSPPESMAYLKTLILSLIEGVIAMPPTRLLITLLSMKTVDCASYFLGMKYEPHTTSDISEIARVMKRNFLFSSTRRCFLYSEFGSSIFLPLEDALFDDDEVPGQQQYVLAQDAVLHEVVYPYNPLHELAVRALPQHGHSVALRELREPARVQYDVQYAEVLPVEGVLGRVHRAHDVDLARFVVRFVDDVLGLEHDVPRELALYKEAVEVHVELFAVTQHVGLLEVGALEAAELAQELKERRPARQVVDPGGGPAADDVYLVVGYPRDRDRHYGFLYDLGELLGYLLAELLGGVPRGGYVPHPGDGYLPVGPHHCRHGEFGHAPDRELKAVAVAYDVIVIRPGAGRGPEDKQHNH